VALFGEAPSRVILAAAPGDIPELVALAAATGVELAEIGVLAAAGGASAPRPAADLVIELVGLGSPRASEERGPVPDAIDLPLAELRMAWEQALPRALGEDA
jgi:hypothetical protein